MRRNALGPRPAEAVGAERLQAVGVEPIRLPAAREHRLNLAIVEHDVGSRIILQPFLGRETVAQTEEKPLALFHLGNHPGANHPAVALGVAAVLERDAIPPPPANAS